jgi:hypothetical protein
MRPDLTRSLALSLALLGAAAGAGSRAAAQTDSAGVRPAAGAADPRVGLGGGWLDAKSAARGLELVAHRDRPEGFFNPANTGDFGYANSDLAFRGTLVFQGGYNGVQVWDVADPANPVLRSTLVCPGGQGDVSVRGNLLFMSVEETRGRVDCGTSGVDAAASPERFRGVRIFDVADVARPRQVAAVQTCRGSHTHTLVTAPRDSANLYVYVSGTSPSRPAAELAGCDGDAPQRSPNNPYFRIEVIRVPLAAPQQARVVSSPRVFADRRGNPAGLFKGGSQGADAQSAARTDQCHDITAYPELGLAAGACAGNGILLDIRDPASPRRVDEVSDPNFAYWHSATFSNDGSKLLFSDEWGGGTAPRCRATDNPLWGANALFTLAGNKMRPAGHYKLPAAQTAQENCVAHNGSLIPVPGRDLMVQAWYQGGVSVFDLTDPKRPVEVAFFDRGPIDSTQLRVGGFWSAYWYNGHIYGSEMGRGLDVLSLTPSALLSQNEIDAAKLVRADGFNPQLQTRAVWPASFVVARAYLDQLNRAQGLPRERATAVGRDLDAAERLRGAPRRAALTRLASRLRADAAGAADAPRVRAMAAAVQKLAAAR